MKISKIACVALLGVAMSSTLFAGQIENDYNAYQAEQLKSMHLEDLKKLIPQVLSDKYKGALAGITAGDLMQGDEGKKAFGAKIVELVNTVKGAGLTEEQTIEVPFGTGDNKITLKIHDKVITITDSESTHSATITVAGTEGKETVTVVDDNSVLAKLKYEGDTKAQIDNFEKIIGEDLKRGLEISKIIEQRKALEFANRNLADIPAFEDEKGLTERLINSGKMKNDLESLAVLADKSLKDQRVKEEEAIKALNKAHELANATDPNTEAIKEAVKEANAKLFASGITIDGKTGNGGHAFNEDGSDFKADNFKEKMDASKIGTNDSERMKAIIGDIKDIEKALASIKELSLSNKFLLSQQKLIDRSKEALKTYQKEVSEISAEDMAKFNEVNTLIANKKGIEKAKDTLAETVNTNMNEAIDPDKNKGLDFVVQDDRPSAFSNADTLKTAVIDKATATLDALKGQKETIKAFEAGTTENSAVEQALTNAKIDKTKIKKEGGAPIDLSNGTDKVDAETIKAINMALAEAQSALEDVVSKGTNYYTPYKELETKLTQVTEAIDTKKGELTTPGSNFDQITHKLQSLEDSKAELEMAMKDLVTKSVARVDHLVKSGEITGMDAEVGSGLGDIVNTNDIAKKMFVDGTDAKVIKDFIVSNTKSINQATDSLNSGLNNDMLRITTNLSTATRLAKLSNPFNADLALAYAIKNLQNDSFASSDNVALSSVVKDYTNRFNNDNNLWGNIIGLKGNVKDGGNPELFGFMLGYDKAFDNAIVGGYATYAKSRAKDTLVTNEADNYVLGGYTRFYVENSEIDFKLSVGTAKNDINRDVIDPMTGLRLSNKGDYKTLFANIDVDYGYVIGLDNAAFIKPMIGLGYSYNKNKAFTESGDLPLSFDATKSKVLSLKAGVEFRKYVAEGNYLYLAPSVERDLYKKLNDGMVRFVGSERDIKVAKDEKKSTYFNLQTGAEVKLTDSVSTNINFGIKAKSKEQYYNGLIGVKYSF